MLDRVSVVMVGTSHPGNIGATARAMAVMGLSKLVLAKPRCEVNEQSEAMASKGLKVLQNRVETSNLAEALAGQQLVIGASARVRGLDWPLVSPREASAIMAAKLNSGEASQVAWVLGREDTGLTNEELAHCHYHVHIPTSAEYSSLNVAAAAQLLAYESRLALLDSAESPAERSTEESLATGDDLEFFFDHLEQVMVDVGFHNRAEPKLTMQRLRKLFYRSHPKSAEISILRGILSGVQRKLANK